jgi:hypothetical protein
MKVMGKIGEQQIVILIDAGSTHSFVALGQEDPPTCREEEPSNCDGG